MICLLTGAGLIDAKVAQVKASLNRLRWQAILKRTAVMLGAIRTKAKLNTSTRWKFRRS
jgi:hypothetical protein